MNTFQLECFLAVADTLSFVRASERMNITQPAVTGQIHALEEELGCRLFNRTTRSVSLTEDGLVFLGDARRIIDITRVAKERFRQGLPQDREDLAIGFHVPSEAVHLTGALRALRERHPNVNPQLVTIPVPFQQIYNQLSDGHLDLVLSFCEDVGRKNLEYTEIAVFDIAVMVRKDHPFARRQSIESRELEDIPLILSHPRNSPTRLDMLQHSIASGRAADQLYMAPSLEAAGALVEAGFGIAIAPKTRYLMGKDLRMVPIKDGGSISYGVYCLKGEQRQTVKYFIECLKRNPDT